MTYEEILTRMCGTYEAESGVKPDDASDIGIRLKVLAGELFRAMTALDWMKRQAFPQTAVGAELDLHAEQRGLTRREARKAAGILTFSRTVPLEYDLLVPAGTVCAAAGESMSEYETAQDAVLPAGKTEADAPAWAIEGGTGGNAAAGCINTLVTPPAGIEYVINRQAFTGGKAAERDSELRRRLLDSYSVVSNGANPEFYLRTALEVPGVASASVVPRENGKGTVTVYIWGDGEEPSAELIEAVSGRLNGLREVSVDVTVKAAKLLKVVVVVYIRPKAGSTYQQAADNVEARVQQFFAEKKIGDHVYRSEINALVMSEPAVEDCMLASNVMDMIGVPGEIPVLGRLTMAELV